MTETKPQTPAESDTAERSLRLVRPRREAALLLRNHIKLGGAIREQRIRDMHGLDQARTEKQEWVSRTNELMAALFGDPNAAPFFFGRQ